MKTGVWAAACAAFLALSSTAAAQDAAEKEPQEPAPTAPAEREIVVDTCKVGAKRHTDDFTGKHVLVTRLVDRDGTVKGGATVEFDPKNGAQLVVTTPSGIQVTVRDTCMIEPEFVAIKSFTAFLQRDGVLLGWETSVEGPEVAAFHLYRSDSEGGAFAMIGKVSPRRAPSIYSHLDPFTPKAGTIASYRLTAVVDRPDGTQVEIELGVTDAVAPPR
jgi:hypothetical protein